MRIVSPAPNARFEIAADGTAPTIAFSTDAAGPHVWEWTLQWRTYRERGRVQTPGNSWRASSEFRDLGGRLEVRASVPGGAANIAVSIVGTNPTPQQLQTYANAQPDSEDLLRIIDHESRAKHFTPQGEPIRSFDGGYGLAQLTNPVPTFKQCWSWKRNVDGALALLRVKRQDAIRYLAGGGRTYTRDQLRRETIARWNGGRYHDWNGTAWARPANMLCAPGTGNIGWDMDNPANAGRTLAQLRARDAPTFNRPPRPGANWRYLGICYVDALLQ